MILKDQVAIITGAGGGIGKGIAYRFAREGAKIVIAEYKGELGEKAAGDIREACLGSEVIAVQTDVSRKDSVEDLVEKVADRFGRMDILVNCAGVAGADGPFLEVTMKRWQQVIGVNLTGIFIITQVVARWMVKNSVHGKIVNIASVNSILAQKNAAAYVASKGGVLMLTKAVAVDLAEYGIRCNCIAPGSIRVDRNAPYMDSEPMKSALQKGIPLGHIGEPGDIAATALFLASDDSKFITGTCISVDGGFSAYFRVD